MEKRAHYIEFGNFYEFPHPTRMMVGLLNYRVTKTRDKTPTFGVPYHEIDKVVHTLKDAGIIPVLHGPGLWAETCEAAKIEQAKEMSYED